jgi:ribosome-binding factor A
MTDPVRHARLEELVLETLADLLVHEIKDPRLDGVTVSSIRLNPELVKAEVYFSVLGDEERERQAADGFAAAGPFLRRQLGKRLRLRNVPELVFSRDTSYEYGDRMERILAKLRAEGQLGDSETSEDSEDSEGSEGRASEEPEEDSP